MFDISILSCLKIDTTKLGEVELKNEDENTIELSVKTRKTDMQCPNCKSVTSKVKDYACKVYKFYGLNSKTIIVNYYQRRYFCSKCGHTFVEPNIFNNSKNYKLTKNLRIQIIQLLRENRSVKSIAQDLGVSDTIIFKVLDEIKPKHGPIGKIMCLDEFTRVHYQGKMLYAALLINGETKDLIDILPSRSKEYIISYLYSLNEIERKKVKYLSIDMWEPYKQAFNTVFTNITIVVDRFHFLRYITLTIDKIRIRVMKTYNKKDLNYYILKKFNRYLLKTEVNSVDEYLCIKHSELKMKTSEKKIIDYMLALNYDLKIAYDFLHSFMVNYKNRNYDTALVKVDGLIKFLEMHQQIAELYDLGKLFKNWQVEITNSFLVVDGKTINNAICEGVNRKIKALKRISFGITNFDHLRNRVFLIYKGLSEEEISDYLKTTEE